MDMNVDSKGNGHKAAGRPDGGQFDRRRGAGDDSDLGAECAYRTVSDYDQGRKLASDAIGRRRGRPVVLMSCSLRTGRPTVNPALIADRAGDGVDVVVLDGGGEDGFNSIAKPRGLGIWNGTVRAWRATGTSYRIKPGFDMVDSIAGWASWHAPAKAKPVDWHARAVGPQARADALEACAGAPKAPDHEGMFADDDPRLHDLLVRAVWAERVPAGEKDSKPLPDRWSYADDLLPLPPMVGAKAPAKAMMEALTGLDADSKARDPHMLDNGRGGTGPRLGEWGHPIWRSRIGAGKGAPTLLHTRDDQGGIVFLHAGHHDDWLL